MAPSRSGTFPRACTPVPQDPLAIAFRSGAGLAEAREDTDTGGLQFNVPFTRLSSPDQRLPTGADSLPALRSMLGDMSPSADLAAADKSVIFSYYEFLQLKGLCKLPPADVRYLELKGCFRVPTGAHLDNFLRQYFLHAHPCMPVVDEAGFWSSYEQGGLGGSSTISLLLFQAMLFTASAFVPLGSLRACGFSDRNEARETLHQRAALLYQLKADTDHTTIAQAALLLSFQSSAIDVYSNTSFLSTAIHAARASQACLYKTLPGLTTEQRRYKKRLWWCCVVRDRTIALGVRRPLQITPESFNPREDPLVEDDLESEMERSRVYDLDIKRCLIKLFLVHCDLSAALTSTVMTICPPNSVPIPLSPTYEDLFRLFTAAEGCRHELKAWFDTAETHLRHASRTCLQRTSFVMLYVDLRWIYYFTAQMALSHSIIFASSTTSHALRPDWIARLDISKSDLMTSFIGLKNVFKRLVASNLAGHLPISASAYTAVPLLLISLDVQLSSSEGQKVKRMRELSYCAEAMRQYASRFQFAQFVSGIVCKVLQLLDATSNPAAMSRARGNILEEDMVEGETRPQTWCELYIENPQLYFTLLFSLDHSLAWGKVPTSHELPDWSLSRRSPRVDRSPQQLNRSSADKRRLSVTPGLRHGVSELSPTIIDLGENMTSSWMSNDQWESFLSISPRLTERIYFDDSPRLGMEQATSPVALSTSAIFPDKPEEFPGSNGDDAQDCESISDTLSFMLQYSCPAIG
ncbi:fungal-specific transcription factor domain-containing protein [Aspergillus crustosus]